MTGKVFGGRYQINDRIGTGGMAEVHRAQDTVLGRNVAVKVMLPQYATDDDFTRRFRQEAAASANLQSPYIVNVYDWGQEDQTYYIVMEFVRGGDLKTAIQQRGAINQRKVAEIGSQVCQALSVAHKQDIIHRDIKPQNIMVQPDGNVKVMDFGIARAKNSVSNKTSSVLGTAHYISPEQAQGKELTAASDIYSLGIVLYEATTGKLPFDGPDAVSVALMQVKDYPPEPHEINPDIDPAFEQIIMKAMEKDPADRFATANDMRLALNDYLAGRSSSDFTKAQTNVMAGSSAAADEETTQLMPSVDDDEGVKGAHAKTYDQSTGGKKSHRGLIIGIICAVVALCLIGGIAYALTRSGDGSGGFLSGCSRTETVSVPDVVGKTQAEAIDAIEKASLEVGTVSTQTDESIAAGVVISQDPDPSKAAETNSKVNLVVSLGAETFEMPDFKGLNMTDARALADKWGLNLELDSTEESAEVESNCIVRQNPDPGTKAKAGDTVYYVLSTGSPNVDVPSVVGLNQDAARSRLEDDGLTVNMVNQYSDDVASGNVISQSIDAGTSVAKGSSITIYVSSGVDPNKAAASNDNAATDNGEEDAGNITYNYVWEPGDEDDYEDDDSQSGGSGGGSSGGSSGTGSTYDEDEDDEGYHSSSQSSNSSPAPSMKGWNASAAETALENSGYSVDVEYGSSGDVDAGEVYDQRTNPDGSVTIYIESGSSNED